jgi:hypothetical protein
VVTERSRSDHFGFAAWSLSEAEVTISTSLRGH